MNFHFLFLIFLFSSYSWSRPQNIRVLIGKSLNEVVISGTDLSRYDLATKKKVLFSNRNKITFNCNKLKDFKYVKPSTPLFLVKSATQLLRWQGQGYIGNMLITAGHKSSGCNLIHISKIDNYLSTLLSKEMNKVWPIESLKAQAVAARSYAINMIESGHVKKKFGYETHYDLESSEQYQVSGSFFNTNTNTHKAVWETKGKILTTQKKKRVPVFYHAKCGGHTKLPEEVWRNSVEGYTKVRCNYCKKYDEKSWEYDISDQSRLSGVKKLLNKYYQTSPTKTDVKKSLFFNSTHYHNDVPLLIKGRHFKIKKSHFRKTFGVKRVKSNNFHIVQDGDSIKLIGKGRGHGVGLCQLGALEMAKQGHSFDEILKFYFPNHLITDWY